MKGVIFAAVSVLAAPVLASGTFTYADFEASVNHIDLEKCPEGLAEGDVLCRVSMHNGALHVFVFESEGQQNFVSVHTFHEDEIEIEFND